jgi:hypothetical protein
MAWYLIKHRDIFTFTLSVMYYIEKMFPIKDANIKDRALVNMAMNLWVLQKKAGNILNWATIRFSIGAPLHGVSF